MPLTPGDIEDIRSLRAEGHRTSAIAETYNVSQRRVQQLTEDPPTADELAAAAERKAELAAAREEGAARFAGFVGEDALAVADVFGLPADGGDAFEGPGGEPRLEALEGARP